ncbi:MAG: acyl-CoA thioesterase [Gammaproteobacteria bacterium]
MPPSVPAWDGRAVDGILAIDPAGPDRYRGRCNDINRYGVIFGGQYLGQGLAAACLSVEGAAPHALFSQYLRSGTGAAPVDYAVQRLRDGRNFATRAVSARQDGRDLFRMDVSFHRGAQGYEHQDAVPPPVPGPEALADLATLGERYREAIPDQSYRRLSVPTPFDVRPVQPEDLLLRRAARAGFETWIRLRGDAPADPRLHPAAFAFASDYLVSSCAAIGHTRTIFSAEYHSFSLNHSLWLHRPLRLQAWMLCVAHSPLAHDGRGFIRMRYFDRDGALLATMVQENVIGPGARETGASYRNTGEIA